MTFSDLQDIKAMDMKALQKELKNAQKYKNALRFEKSQGTLKDTSQLKKTKIHIARIRTAETQRRQEMKKVA